MAADDAVSLSVSVHECIMCLPSNNYVSACMKACMRAEIILMGIKQGRNDLVENKLCFLLNHSFFEGSFSDELKLTTIHNSQLKSCPSILLK